MHKLDIEEIVYSDGTTADALQAIHRFICDMRSSIESIDTLTDADRIMLLEIVYNASMISVSELRGEAFSETLSGIDADVPFNRLKILDFISTTLASELCLLNNRFS